MNLDEAFLYLGIDPKKDISLDEIEKNYNAKKSLYELSRFKSDSPEFEEAKKMSECIESAYNCVIDSLAEFYDEEKKEISQNNFHNSNRFINSHFLSSCVIGLVAIGLLIFAAFVSFSDNKADKVSVSRQKTEQNTSRENNNSYNDIKNIVNIALQEYERNEKNRKNNINENNEKQETQKNTSNIINYAELTEKVMPSMVKINAYIGTKEKRGSGFFVSNRGDILTNYHVIEDAESIMITPSNSNGIYALVKDYDEEKDIALLKVNLPSATPFLKISSKLPKQGEAVMAVGNPRGLEGTVSNGIVSAFRGNNTWIQFTAPISQGSSGGALINSLGEVVGMPTMLRIDGQNLNFAISPIILLRFFNSARNKTPREMPKIASGKRESNSPSKNSSELIFVKKDESYEIYLDKEAISYNKESSRVYFMTIWYPSEKTKRQIEKDPNFDLIPGKNLGIFALYYIADFSNNTYVHLRTVNFYDDGSIARDYMKPDNEIIFETPKKGSRIESLMQALSKQLNIKNNRSSNIDNDGIRLPDKNGFLVHKWGCSVESVRKYVSSPLKRLGDAGEIFTTYRFYKVSEFQTKIDFGVVYLFDNDRLNSVIFITDGRNKSGSIFSFLTSDISRLYGSYKTQGSNVRIWNGNSLYICLENDTNNKVLTIEFSPLY